MWGVFFFSTRLFCLENFLTIIDNLLLIVVSTESAIENDDFDFDILFMRRSRSKGPPVESDTSNVNSGIFLNLKNIT